MITTMRRHPLSGRFEFRESAYNNPPRALTSLDVQLQWLIVRTRCRLCPFENQMI